MENYENDILGFDPTQLSVFDEKPAQGSTGNPLVYHTRPAESKSEDHVYRSTIKVIYSPQDMKHSIIEQQAYAIHDNDGWLTVVSSLTNGDKNCPIFKAWKKCHFSEEGSILWKQAASTDEGGKGLFDKRYGRYVTIQVLKDKNHPELEGKYMFWKLPKTVWEMIDNKMNPSKESGKAPIPIMDFLFGRSIDLEVKPGPGKPGDINYTRQTSYMAEISEDCVSCTNPDGSPLLNDSEKMVLNGYVTAMKEVWKSKDPAERATLLANINQDLNTKQLREIYNRVLEKIKGFCPDLNKEMGYKEWDAATSARVQKWIDVVLSGNDPAADAAPVVVANAAPDMAAAAASLQETPAAFATMPEAAPEDDLPF